MLERAAALAACLLAAVLISRRLLEPDVFSDDAFVHQYWMWRFRDDELFTDPLTAQLRESGRYPVGYEALFWLGTLLAGPIVFGEWLGVGLMALSGWLVFLIVREHSEWRPAAWIAAALFLALSDIHRFHGGFQRAFVHPAVLLTVLLALRGRPVAAALVAAASALIYPPAALLSVGVLGVAALWPPRERRRIAAAALAALLAAGAVLVPALLSGGAPDVMSAAEARRFPEFGGRGTLHFFVSSPIEYLKQNRSGFDLRATGSIVLIAALAALLARRGNARLLRREVVALPLVALAAFAAAQAVLFRLYLPHRYTYPLVAFCAIAVAVALLPTWQALWERPRRLPLAVAVLCAPVAIQLVGVHAFPLGPTEPLDGLTRWVAPAAAVAAATTAYVLARFGAPSAGALLTGLALVAALVVTEHGPRGSPCARHAATGYLAQLPKDAVIAGDPNDLKCLPATARRAVVISTQLAPSYEPGYFRTGRERMFAMLRAYYGRSPAAIDDLRARYGATHLWVRRNAIARERAPGRGRWAPRKLPYGRYVDRLVRAGDPAVLRLPHACLVWARGAEEVYDLECVGHRMVSSSSPVAHNAAVAGRNDPGDAGAQRRGADLPGRAVPARLPRLAHAPGRR